MLGSVQLWREAIRLTPLGMVKRRGRSSTLKSAADAWAAGDKGGIGGWWQTGPAVTPDTCGWLSLQFTRADLPEEFDLPENRQHCISSLELLAQLALLRGRCVPGFSRHAVCIKQMSDNTPTEGAVNKLFTTSKPLMHFLQPLVATAVTNGIELQVDHEPGIQTCGLTVCPVTPQIR